MELHCKVLVKCICETAPKSSFTVPTSAPVFKYMPGLACEKNHCQFTIQFEGKFETISGNLLSLLGSQIKDIGAALQMLLTGATILEITVEKIVYLDSIFLNIVALPVLPSPPSPESNVVVYSKESLILGHLWEATLNWGKGFFSAKVWFWK